MQGRPESTRGVAPREMPWLAWRLVHSIPNDPISAGCPWMHAVGNLVSETLPEDHAGLASVLPGMFAANPFNVWPLPRTRASDYSPRRFGYLAARYQKHLIAVWGRVERPGHRPWIDGRAWPQSSGRGLLLTNRTSCRSAFVSFSRTVGQSLPRSLAQTAPLGLTPR